MLGIFYFGQQPKMKDEVATIRAVDGAHQRLLLMQADHPSAAFTFLRDEILIDMSRSPVKTIDRLDRVRGLPRPVEKDHGKAIVELTLKALSEPAPPSPFGRDEEPTPTDRFRSDALWAAAQAICAGRSVDTGVVTSRQECGEFYRVLAAGEDLGHLRLMKGWRREALGQPLADFFHGNSRLAVSWAGGTLRTEPAP